MNRPEVLAPYALVPRADVAPEYLQRIFRARQHNQRCAELRILDREFYRQYRSYIVIPTNKVERDRNRRWAQITNMLRLSASVRAQKRGLRLTPCELTGDPS